jgi:small-conductance mechanosensitive channel
MQGGVERRLDDLVRDLRDWVYAEMKETTPEWKYPDVLFIAFGESTNDFALEIFIDDVTREHFDRQDRVITELHKDIAERLREANIDMPVPQRELSIRNGHTVIGR